MGKLKPSDAGLFDIENRLLTVTEVAAFCNVSKRTVERWISLRKIPYKKFDGWSVRFVRSEVAEWLDKRSVHPWLYQQK